MLPHEFAILGAAGAGGGASFGPVEFIAAGSAEVVSASPAAPPLPGGWAAGDHAIAIAVHTNPESNNQFTISSGWDVIDNPLAGAGSAGLAAWLRVLEGGDSAPSISHPAVGNTAFQAVVLTFTGFSSYILNDDGNPDPFGTGTDFQIPNGPESSTDADSLAIVIHGKQTGITLTLKSGSEQGYSPIYTNTNTSVGGGLNRNCLFVAEKAVDVESVTLPTVTAGNSFSNCGISLILQP
jgi:hypothetical protein